MSNNTENQNEESGNNSPDSTVTVIWKRLLGLSKTILGTLGISAVITGATVGVASFAVPALAVAIATTVVGGAVAIIKNVISDEITENSSGSFIGTFPSDKLFTDYAVIPVIILDDGTGIMPYDFAYANGLYHKQSPSSVGAKIKGFCEMKYQVAIGYKNVSDLIGNAENKKAACEGRFSDLPSPEILSTYPLKQARGYNTKYNCEAFENQTKPDGTLKLHGYIVDVLNDQTQSLEHLKEKSKKVLGSFIKVNCLGNTKKETL